jgi:hypothetical protein
MKSQTVQDFLSGLSIKKMMGEFPAELMPAEG